ncbi:MAG: NAD(P)/FAD-dependent oxidoreductase, partial [Opitutales bacterium]|nr:NAD(P)/FAD-dependent oxidoreductase [Opitutales bacterium]
MNVAIIGAGAAGMFCAANLKPEAHADIYEAARFPLRKVLASGGGRCNFTNENIDSSNPADFYPRGGGSLKKPLRKFGAAAAR